MHSQLYRTVDANINRTAEGLRVLEDISRFVLNDRTSSLSLKEVRHDLIRVAIKYGVELLNQRNIIEDFGSVIDESALRPDLPSIISANSRRVQEGLRVLEELSKLPHLKSITGADKYKKTRFNVYQIERNLVSKLLRKNKINLMKGLYVVLDTKFISLETVINVAVQTITGGARIIQLRDKLARKRNLLSLARNLRKICSSHDVLFIINDYLDIALASNADGIHLGQDDLPLKEARRFLPIDRIIGCSVSTVAQAKQAQKDGADYIAVGAIYPTATKGDIKIVGLNGLSKIRKTVDLPIVAIGGINKRNLTRVFSCGADSVAVISALLTQRNIEKSTADFIRNISRILKNQISHNSIQPID